MYDLLRQRNEGVSDAVIDLTKDLIRTPSLSRAERGVSDRLVRAMHESRAFDRVLADEVGNVVGVQFGIEPGPALLLLSHQDTVPVDAADAWSHSPYGATDDGGAIWGVGAADCKGGIAAQLYAAVILRRSLLPLRGALVVAATVAEENGVGIGIRHLLDQTLPELDLTPAFAILGEPTDLGIYYGHDGWVDLEIHVEGRDLFQVVDAGDAIRRDFGPAPAEANTAVTRAMVDVGAPRVVGVNGRSRAVVPVERRLLRGESLGDVIQQVRSRAAVSAQATGRVGVEVEVAEQRQELYTGVKRTTRLLSSPWNTDPFSTLPRRAYHALGAAECGRRTGEWTLSRLGMGTAGSTLVNDFRIATIGYGPGHEELAHARDEHVKTEKIRESVYGTAAMVQSLIGVPVYGWSADEI
ncbi:MAG: M20/M25/M40 family metallo-hydrolase [Polyangiaceae bacterium]|nr:M20/M25/M40 family metallo-hydrolase [Polyangiaceae bacterium]